MPVLSPWSCSLLSGMVCLVPVAIPYSSWYFSQSSFWPSTTGMESLGSDIWETHSVSMKRAGIPAVIALLSSSVVM